MDSYEQQACRHRLQKLALPQNNGCFLLFLFWLFCPSNLHISFLTATNHNAYRYSDYYYQYHNTRNHSVLLITATITPSGYLLFSIIHLPSLVAAAVAAAVLSLCCSFSIRSSKASDPSLWLNMSRRTSTIFCAGFLVRCPSCATKLVVRSGRELVFSSSCTTCMLSR